MKQPPKAKKEIKRLEHHGHVREDPYYWLNQRDDEEVLHYLKAENAYTEETLRPVSELKKTIYDELISRIKKEDESVPFRYNGYLHYTRFEENKEYPIHCRKPENLENKEEIILDVNLLAEGQSFCEVADFSISPDNKLMAYAVDFQGRRKYTVRFKNLETGETMDKEIPDTAGELEWANDNETLFYINIDEQTLRNDKAYAYNISNHQTRLVWHEKNDAFDLTLDKSKSQQFIIITSESKTSSEARILSADTPDEELRIFHKREQNHLYSIDHLDDTFFIYSNKKALNFHVLRCPDAKPDETNWKLIVPHRRKVLVEDFELFDNFLVTEERSNGLVSLVIRDLLGNEDHKISFEEPAYMATIHINAMPDTPWLRYQFSSLTTPKTIVDYNMQTRERKVKKVQEIPGGYNAEDYVSERVWAKSHDMVQVPISLVRKKDTPVDGSAPLLLYGYGSYGISSDATFNQARLSLLERGFIFAIAHIRGGEEMGRSWYEEEGKLMHKMNTFHDFIACANHLVANNFTTKDRLFALGGSAGGMLMGAVMNMRPDLFKGIVAIVPFVDVVTTMLDPSIPLTTQEYDEWGNPNDESYYKYMLQYSPYDNITNQKYPALLASTGYHDSQVQYWEPAKWVARLRENQEGEEPILLNINFDSGHGGASGRYEQYKEVALYYAFILGLHEGKIGI